LTPSFQFTIVLQKLRLSPAGILFTCNRGEKLKKALGAGMGTLSGSMETMLAIRWSWQGVWGFGFSDQGNIPTPRELTGSDLTKVLRNRELELAGKPK